MEQRIRNEVTVALTFDSGHQLKKGFEASGTLWIILSQSKKGSRRPLKAHNDFDGFESVQQAAIQR